MPQFQLPFEIIKLFDVIEDPKTGEKRIDLDKNYARYIQDNFDQILKYINEGITLENIGEQWTDWTPTYGAESPMTFTSVTTVVAKYIVIDTIVYFILGASGTTGGTASPAIYFSPPYTVDKCEGGGCHVVDTNRIGGYWLLGTSTRFEVYKYDESNFGLGAGRGIYLQGFYKTV